MFWVYLHVSTRLLQLFTSERNITQPFGIYPSRLSFIWTVHWIAWCFLLWDTISQYSPQRYFQSYVRITSKSILSKPKTQACPAHSLIDGPSFFATNIKLTHLLCSPTLYCAWESLHISANLISHQGLHGKTVMYVKNSSFMI